MVRGLWSMVCGSGQGFETFRVNGAEVKGLWFMNLVECLVFRI